MQVLYNFKGRYIVTKGMKKNGPFQIKGSIEKYTNPWLSVREDQVIRPDGKDGIYGVVTILPGISVLPIDDNGDVYLEELFEYAISQTGIETVSGGIDKDETPLAAAKRELQEELGISAKEWTDLGLINPFTGTVNSPATLFIAKKLAFEKAAPEATEQFKVLRVPFREALKMAIDGRITHSPSVVLILKAARQLEPLIRD
jgi:ADP-ribose pyrophosphatase